MNRRIASLAIAAIVGVAGLAACSSGDDTGDRAATSTAPTTASTAVESTVSPTSDTTSDTTAATTADTPADTADTTAAADTTVPATEPPATDAPATTTPDAVQSVPGLAAVELTAAGDDPQRPTFSWVAPGDASSYQLIVQSADGTPIWAWTGAATTIGLGGDALPADVEGPTLAGAARARVYALDAGNGVIGVSPWITVPGA